MATGDNAAARGMDLVPGSAAANTIDTELNKTRDYVDQYTRWGAIAAKPTSFPNNDVTQATADGTAAGSAGKLVKFGVSGNIAVATPTANAHAATKAYADAVGTTAFTGDTIMRRNADGQTAVGAPTSASHAARKADVDAVAADLTDVKRGELDDYVYGHEITTTRRSVWIQSNGDLGWAPSSRHKKQNIRPAELTLDQLRGIPVVLYRYRKAVAAERAGKIDHAPTEVGTIAEDLHALDLWQFVIYDDGKPIGVHYDLLALAALSLGQQLADKLDRLDDRVTRLEQS